MAWTERAMAHRAGRQNQYGTSLHFKKKGADIKETINNVTKNFMECIEKNKAEIATICKRREIDPKEVIDAGSDENAVQTYSTKMEAGLGNNKTNSLIRELQDDITTLKVNASNIESFEQDIASLERIQKNIEPAREFDLSYNELVEFGF